MTDKKIFLPLTLDNSTKTYFSGKQIFGIILFGLGFLLFQVLCLRMHTDLFSRLSFGVVATIAVDLAGSYFIIFLFRKVVLQENKMMRAYQQNQNLQKTDISFCWDIFTIRDNKIFYCNGSQGIIVSLSHGYLLDRAANQERVHRDLVKKAIGNLAKQGYRFLYYNREVRDSNLGPLSVTEHNLYKYKDTKIYDTANKIIKHTYKVCQSVANTEQEYYVILADSMSTIKKLDHIAKEFLNTLKGGIYVKTWVLNDAEIWDFISSLFGISYVDPSVLLSKKFAEQQVQLVTVIDVDREQSPSDEQTIANNTKTGAAPLAGDTSPATAQQLDPNWQFLYEGTGTISDTSDTNEEDIIL